MKSQSGRRLAILIESSIKKRDDVTLQKGLRETLKNFNKIQWSDRMQILHSLVKGGKSVPDRVRTELIWKTTKDIKRQGLSIMQPRDWSRILWAITKEGNESEYLSVSHIACEEFNRRPLSSSLHSSVTSTLANVSQRTGNIKLMESVINYMMTFSNNHFIAMNYKPRDVANVVYAASELQVWHPKMTGLVEKFTLDSAIKKKLQPSDITMILHSVVVLNYNSQNTNIFYNLGTLVEDLISAAPSKRCSQTPVGLDQFPGILYSMGKGGFSVSRIFNTYAERLIRIPRDKIVMSEIAVACSSLAVSESVAPKKLIEIIYNIIKYEAINKTGIITEKHLATILSSIYRKPRELRTTNRSMLKKSSIIIQQLGWSNSNDAISIVTVFSKMRYQDAVAFRTLEEHYHRGQLVVSKLEATKLIDCYRNLSYDTAIWSSFVDLNLAFDMITNPWNDIHNLQRSHPLGPKKLNRRMEGANQLWLRARMVLEPVSFNAFQNMYSVANSPPLAKAWYLRLDIEKVIKVCEVMAIDSEAMLKATPVDASKDFPEPTEYEDPNEINMVEIKVAGSETLRCLSFGVNSESYPTSIRTTYPGQLVAKVDSENTSLLIELFEATPFLEPFFEWPISDERATKITQTFHTNPGEVPETIEPESPDVAKDKIRFFFMDAFSHFRETRVLRLRLALHNISSIALLKEPVTYSVGEKIEYLSEGIWRDGTILKSGPFMSVHPAEAENAEESRLLLHQHVRPKRTLTGVLVLTSTEPAESFCARCVFSETMSYNEFEFCGDWTPDQAASESLRQYIVGDIPELERIVAEMCRASPHLCDRVQGPKSGVNETLLPVETPALEETRPPHLRRCPLFGPIDGLHELDAEQSSPSLIAGQEVGLAEQLVKSAEDRDHERHLVDEKAAVTALCGLQEDPDFVFPSIGTDDPLLSAAEEFAKTGAAPRSVRFQNPTMKQESDRPAYDEMDEPEPLPPPPPSAHLVNGTCSGCQKGGLLPWVRRCPGCGVALVQKVKKTITSASSPAPVKGVPESWEDE